MLNKRLNTLAIKDTYSKYQRVVINNIFDLESAEAVYNSICAHNEWDLCSHGRYADGASRAASDTGQQSNYSFRYHGYDLRKRLNTGLNTFLDYISSTNEFTSFISQVTGDTSINFVSAQATYFDAGSFLRRHSDFHQVNGVQTRKVAFVFGYTREWAADWGGTFHVLNNEGAIIDSLVPGFNNLTLFTVPTLHYVSPVAHYATGRRYAISGWFMDKPQA